jgi:hypothetical protein
MNFKFKIFSAILTFLSCIQAGQLPAQEKKNIQLMLDEDIRAGLVDKKMTVERVINDRILKQAQDELRREGRLSR